MKLPKIAIVVCAPYAKQIVNGSKILEMRGRDTKIRGKVAIIEARSGLIIGEASIHSTFEMKEEEREKMKGFHQVQDLSLLERWCFAYLLSDAIEYKTPVKYNHPRGAVIWVDLTREGVLS